MTKKEDDVEHWRTIADERAATIESLRQENARLRARLEALAPRDVPSTDLTRRAQ